MFLVQLIFIASKFILYNSPKIKTLQKFINLKLLKSSFENFKENIFLTNEFNDSNATSQQYHVNLI